MRSEARGRETFLGLDIGTSSVKALLVDEDQRVVAEASSALEVSRPHPLWSEQNPEDWVEGVEAAVAASVATRRSVRRLAGIGLSGQMHGATFLDARGQAAAARDPVERRALVRRMRRTRAARSRFPRRGRQSRDARLHRARRRCGSRSMSPRCSPRPGASCCRRITCACAFPARRFLKCRTRRARCGSTSPGAPGTRNSSPRAG